MFSRIIATSAIAALFFAGCCEKCPEEKTAAAQTPVASQAQQSASLPERPVTLSLWTEHAPAKDSLEAFVRAVTDSTSPDFIPVERRIAAFDWDGTLFLETAPTYFDWMLFEHRVLDDSTFKPSKQQLKAAREGREKKVFPGLSAERERMVAQAYKGMTLSEFEAYVRAFMAEPQPGFTGLIITDALSMGAIREKYSSSEACIRCIQAGVDILLMPYDYFEAFDGVVKAVESGMIPESRIDESVYRILKFKMEKMGVQ